MKKTTLIPGQTFTEGFPIPLKVMAIAEDYVMARFKGYYPFVEPVEKFEKRLETAKIKSPNTKQP